MAKLTVCFTGICTHLRNVIEGIPHRVVLIHETQDVTIHGMKIQSHAPFLAIAQGNVLSGPKTGAITRVAIRVANASGGPLVYDQLYECAIPRMQNLTPTPLTLDPRVTEGGQRPAGSYFDVESGTFSAGLSNSAAGAMLTIETDGNPRLAVTPMDGEQPYILLTDSAVIELRNVIYGPAQHHDADFMLHCKIFRTIPPDAGFPTSLPHCPGIGSLPVPAVELGPGLEFDVSVGRASMWQRASARLLVVVSRRFAPTWAG